ncbi:MAG: helicase-exonuclease AddAB subunit AddB [Gorillibacterium sp.]|nr:helicase-exonuclease AddAB subunit AddB [Gorillibacterium sp.]
MSLQFVIGRAGSGKSTYCLNEISRKLVGEPEGHPILLIVPEQATFQAEQALAACPGVIGYIRAQVFSFRRLAWRAMQDLGNTAGVPVSDLGKTMLLQRLIHKHEEELSVFRQPSGKLGIAQSLNQFFKDLRRSGLTSAQLRIEQLAVASSVKGGSSDALADKLLDISLLYEDYEQELQQKYLDAETFLDCLAEGVFELDWLKDAEVWVDGFFSFTPQEREVLAKLSLYCRKVTVALSIDRPYRAGEQLDEFDLFHSTGRAMSRLLGRAAELGAVVLETVVLGQGARPRYQNSPMLAHLERNFESRSASRRVVYQGDVTDSSIVLAGAVNRRAEVEGCAREILRLVRDEDRRYRDIAVRIRNMGDYGELIEQVFTDYEIPHFLDQRRPVLHHPLVEFIRSSLEIVNRDWPYEAIFRCVKTDFLLPDEQVSPASTVTRRGMDLLENYVLERGIHSYRWKDDRTWEFYKPVQLEDEAEDEAETDARPSLGSEAELARHKQIRECRDLIVAIFSDFEQAFKRADTVLEKTAALYGLLEICHVPEKLEQQAYVALNSGKPEIARQQGQIWDYVIDLFDQLTEIMGEETVPADLFVSLLDAGLESICLGLVPPALDQVLVGSMDRTRTTQKLYSFVLGANEGIIPAKPEEDGLLTDAERLRMEYAGIDLPGGPRRRLLDEQLLIYSVLCSPSQYLWVSYSLADEEGKSLLPSEMIRQLGLMFPSVKADERLLQATPPVGADSDEAADYITHGDRALTDLSVQLKDWLNGDIISSIWWDVYNWFAQRPEWASRLKQLNRSLSYINPAEMILPATAKLLYGETLRASVSRMERFAACPFSHYVSHGLRLKERKLFRLEAPDIGQLYHAALSQVVRDIITEGTEDWSALSPDRMRERAGLVVDRLTPRLQGEILLSSNRYRYIARKLKDIVTRASTVIADHARGNGFYPVELELAFGPGEKLPPLSFRLDDGSLMDIAGRIDRVDRADGEKGMFLRVIDYKSSPHSLELTDLYNGLSLQMLTYLDVVVTHSERWLGRKAQPAGVLYFHVHNPLLTVPNGLDPLKAEAMLRRSFKMKGLLLADQESIGLMDAQMQTESGNSEIIPIGIKKDGSFRKGASIATEEQWDLMRGHVRKTIRGIGSRIIAGGVEIEPYRQGKKIACTFCSYKSVCQLDPDLPGGEFRSFPSLKGEGIWQAMAETFSAEKKHPEDEKGGSSR